MTIIILSFALSLCSCSCTDDVSVCAWCNRQIPQHKPADWHDLDLYWTIDGAHTAVSDDNNSLDALPLCSCSCADKRIVCFCEIDRQLYNNRLNGTISTFIGQLTALQQLSVTITIVSLRGLSVRVRVVITALCVL